MSKGKKVTIGYKYYLGMHQVLCHGPIDSIKRITADDKELWSGTAAGGTITISKPTIFGGDEREGGVSGSVDVELGGASQGVNAYLASKLGSLTPAFRGVAALVLKQVYMGNSSYPKPWVIRASRINSRTDGSPQWYSAKAAIGEDMNPAHIIVECLTNSEWGMGYNSTDIDLASLQSAADTLYSEGMGISLLWDKSASIEDFIQEILNHIDGSMFVNRTTGKFTLKLARGGYDVNSLLTLNESNVEEISDLKRSTIEETYNAVTVTYWDAATGKEGSVTVNDIAMVAQRGSTIGEKIEFPGFTNGTIANKVAMRELKALSTPLLRCSITANREAAGLNVADVFKLNWPRYGINNVVMRVASIELGTSTDLSVRIECVEDVFSLGTAVYSTPSASGWTDPSTAPAAMPYRSVIEAPYWEIAKRLGETTAAATSSSFGYIVATGTRPSGDALNADLMTNPNNTGYIYADKVDFCPTATLSSGVGYADTVWAIGGGGDLDDVVAGTYAIIDNEFVSIIAISTSSVTVGRGVLDTVPATHAPGARILFVDDFYQVDGQEYVSGETARIKMLPTTAQGTLTVGGAPENTVVMNSRLGRPYPPGALKLNNLAYPTAVNGYSDLVVSWAHRSRLQQTATLIDTTAGSIGPDSGTTYNVKILGQDGSTVLANATGLTGTTYTFSQPPAGVAANVSLLLPMSGTNNGVSFPDKSLTPKSVAVSGDTKTITTAGIPKYYGSCAYFDGSGDRLTVSSHADFNLGTGDFTIGLWFRRASSDTETYARILQFGSDNTAGVLTVFANAATGTECRPYIAGYSGASVTFVEPGVSTTTQDTWHHLEIDRSGNTWYVWIDGLLSNQGTYASYNVIQNALYIGSNNSGVKEFAGYMQDLIIIKGQALHTAPFTPPAQLVPPSDTQLTVELESQQGSLTSWQKHRYTVQRTV